MTASSPSGAGAVVVVPTYNERENLEGVAARLFDSVPDAHLLVVDDDSPDGTGKIADELAASDDRVHVLHRGGKAGLGAAYIAGFDWALAAGYEVVVEMDADGSHPPEQLPRLLTALQHADLVLGSRYVPGGAVVNWPPTRELLSRGGNLYTRMLLSLGLRDATGGYRAYRRAVLEAIDYRQVASQGYCFQVDLARRVVRCGYRAVEVPITFVERERGESKMTGAVVREALLRITRWGVAYRAEQVNAAVRPGKSHTGDTRRNVDSSGWTTGSR